MEITHYQAQLEAFRKAIDLRSYLMVEIVRRGLPHLPVPENALLGWLICIYQVIPNEFLNLSGMMFTQRGYVNLVLII